MAQLAVSPEQLRTLQAIVDTVIAPMTAEETRAAMEVHGGRHGRSAEDVRLLCESAGSGAGVAGAVLGGALGAVAVATGAAGSVASSMAEMVIVESESESESEEGEEEKKD